MMKRILVALDVARPTTAILARAMALASRYDAAVRLLHATSTSTKDAIVHDMRSRGSAMAEVVSSFPVELSARTRSGRPEDAILNEATQFGAELIVLGDHGEPRLRDAMFGTVGTHVLRHAHCPVLIVHNAPGDPYRRVLAAIPDITHADPILRVARQVAPGAELFAVHAFDPSMSQVFAGGDSRECEGQQDREMLARALADSGAPQVETMTHAIVEPGEPTEVIMRQSEAIGPDLIAMGTRRATAYFGSHAVDMMFAWSRDLLIVPDAANAWPGTAA